MTAQISQDDPARVLRLEAVLAFTGLRRTQFLKHVASGAFPQPIKITESGRAVGWLETELREWLASRVEARDAAQISKGGRHG